VICLSETTDVARRGFPELPNSQEYLDSLGPGPYSKQVFADKIADGLKRMTHRDWIVTLKKEGNGKGGVHIAPTPDRLKDGVMTRQDWQVLKEYFGAWPCAARRWYIFPDEIEFALHELLSLGAFPGEAR